MQLKPWPLPSSLLPSVLFSADLFAVPRFCLFQVNSQMGSPSRTPVTGREWVYFSQLTCSENHVLLLMAGKCHSVDPQSTARLGHAWAVYTSTPRGSKCYVQIFRGSHVFISLPECFYQIIHDLGVFYFLRYCQVGL